MTPPRYCFVLPDLHRPMGGQAVFYEISCLLEQAGYDVAIVHSGKAHRYPFAAAPSGVFHLNALARLAGPTKNASPQVRLQHMWRTFGEARRNAPTPPFIRESRDVFILPEFAYPSYATLFPDAPMMIFAQDSAALLRSYTADTGRLHADMRAVLTTSETSSDAVRYLLGRAPVSLRLAVPTAELQADHPKKLQIAYMPRKLKPQSRMITQALRQRPGLGNVPIVAIQNMSNAERNQVLNESLIFLSFSNMEGFGLPPAEAMAAGCIVIGYTGVGANEYFTTQTGFPIEHHDMIGFLRQIEDVVNTYRSDPGPLDTLRQGAATHIRATYTPEAAQRTLLEQWARLDADLSAQMAHAHP